MKKFTSTIFIVLLCVKAFASGHTVTITSTNLTCTWACNGTATAIVSGGVGPFQYFWTPGNITTQQITGLCAGAYTLTVTDGNDMSTVTASVMVFQPSPLSLSISSINSTACGACDGMATAAVNGGTAPYTYLWNNTSGQIPEPISFCSGFYTCNLTDANGCIVVDTAIIYEPSPAQANFTMIPDSTNGLNYYTFNSTVGSGLTYSWDFGDGGVSTIATPTHLFNNAGTYTVSLVVTSVGGCTNSVSKAITANATPATCISLFNIAFDTTSADPYAYTVYNLSYGSTLIYLWSFGDGTTSTLQNPTHVYSGGGPYQLCLTVDNGSGCTQTYCDSLMYVDSLSRTTNQLSITVVDVASPLVTNIQEQSINSSVEVYPNPFSESTTFVIQSDKLNEKYSFELVDVLGKKVRSMNEISTKQFIISRNGLENGIYFYKIYSAESIVGIGKLIVN